MSRYLLDTGVAGDYADRRRGVYDHAQRLLRQGAVIGICVPVLGELWSVVERRGRPIQQIDVQIAAIVRTLPDCTLVTKDSDFQLVPGLKVVDRTNATTT